MRTPVLMNVVIPGGDDLGICAYRRCTDDSECTAPLICRNDVIANEVVCTY